MRILRHSELCHSILSVQDEGMTKQPQLGETAFNCPHCSAYAHQRWLRPYVERLPLSEVFVQACSEGIVVGTDAAALNQVVGGIVFSECQHCHRIGTWVHTGLRWPLASSAPEPHEEMPADIVPDYLEAASILQFSPRGAAALLRLCVQSLFKSLGGPGDLNKTIATYSARGLSPQLIDAMDILRVVGNNAVHPGEMDLKDDQQTAGQLFELLNEVVDELIARPARTARLYAKLPAGARTAIEERNSKARGPS